MASMPTDLSGQWDGHFAYPAGDGPVTPFLAHLTQRGARFSGMIIEPDLYSPGASTEATLIGVISGDAVDFTKTYRKASRGYENPVDYVGQLSDGGDRISGMWSLLDMNGTFEMTRQAKAGAREQRKAQEEA